MKWYTTAELADALHCSVRQVRRLHKYGLIKGIRKSPTSGTLTAAVICRMRTRSGRRQ